MLSLIAPFKAPRIDADEGPLMPLAVPYTGAANLVGFPAISLPAGVSDGLPLAVQIIAPSGEDALALRIAHALEQAAPEFRAQVPAGVS